MAHSLRALRSSASQIVLFVAYHTVLRYDLTIMARSTPTRKKQPLVVRSHTLTQGADTILRQLSQNASDALGWTVGSSAIVRALLQYVEQQPAAWATATLHPLIEQEIANGLFWGRKTK